jgi:hypothetical protein
MRHFVAGARPENPNPTVVGPAGRAQSARRAQERVRAPGIDHPRDHIDAMVNRLPSESLSLLGSALTTLIHDKITDRAERRALQSLLGIGSTATFYDIITKRGRDALERPGARVDLMLPASMITCLSGESPGATTRD